MEKILMNKLVWLAMAAFSFGVIFNWLNKPEQTIRTTPHMDRTAASVDCPPDSTLDKIKEWDAIIEGTVKTDVLSGHDLAEIYILRFRKVAVAEQEKFGIPASITLAQGILESNKGQSRLTKTCNNHFGIKCFSRTCKKGHCKNFTDDTHKDFFVNYASAWESFRHHSYFLKGERYKPCFECKTDYKCWAKQLKKCGYATSPTYERKLISIVKRYNLQMYDTSEQRALAAL